ncbi:hypothetical protein O1Y80_000817 [Yersinia enterocolitica]|nr:hypothetical protein [Yersinia enterocolitica]EKN3831226.1 hypothetical protein [Yersinia enterocolitica]
MSERKVHEHYNKVGKCQTKTESVQLIYPCAISVLNAIHDYLFSANYSKDG